MNVVCLFVKLCKTIASYCHFLQGQMQENHLISLRDLKLFFIISEKSYTLLILSAVFT